MDITKEQVVKYGQKTLMTTSTLSDETKANTRYLFKGFKAIYSHKFMSMYATSDDQAIAMKLWAIKISPFTRAELDQALLDAADVHEWVPSISEFIAILKSNRNKIILFNSGPVVKVYRDKKIALSYIEKIRKAFHL